MYEDITYEELKGLSEDKKVEVWKELHSKYSDDKELAKKLGVATIAVINGVRKYALGEHIGRTKKEEVQEEAKQVVKEESTQPEVPTIQLIKPKRQYNRKPKEEKQLESITDMKEEMVESVAEVKPEPIKVNESEYSILLKKEVLGEEAQARINSIANTLIKDQKYEIEILIKEI